MTSAEKKLTEFIYKNKISVKTAASIMLENFYENTCKSAMRCMSAECISILNASEDEIVYVINKNAIDTLFVGKNNIRIANNLLWECKSMKQYVCIDTDDLMLENEQNSKLMNRKLWNYIANNATDDIEGGAWINSYTRQHFTKEEMKEYADNVIMKVLPFLNGQKKILEIGCSSGLTMYSLAPLSNEYVAIDISNRIIEKNKIRILNQNINNIKLFCLYAHEVEKIAESNFDIIIMNSVAQCFQGHFYFMRVFELLIKKMNDNGIIFIGDIMDADKKIDFLQSLIEYRIAHNANTKIDFSNELFFSKDFFNHLYIDYPEIKEIKISSKYYSIENELTKFRFDALIELNKNARYKHTGNKKKFYYSCNLSAYN